MSRSGPGPRFARWCSGFGARLAAATRRRGRAPAVRELAAQLAGQETALEQLAAEIERYFVAIGRTLPAQAELTRTLAAQGARLVAIGGGGETATDPAAAAVAFAHQVLASIDGCSRERHQLLDRLAAYQARTGRLLAEEAQVERILAPLRVIQTFFRIESARLPAEMQSGFHALSGEIPKFEQQVRETFGRHAEALSATCQRIEIARQRMQVQEQQQQQTAQSGRTRLTHALEASAAELAGFRRRHARLAGLVDEIDRETRSLVVGLQYQDITRQKMEHIREALADLRARPTDRAHRRAEAGNIGETCALEAAQCRAVGHDLDQALDAIGRGSGTIRERLGRIEAECWSRAGFPAAIEAAGARVAALEAVLIEIQSLAPTVLASADDALQVVSSFGTVAADVATTARDMAESMRLIALNAQVLAAQAGDEGAGLLVLAERTYGISEEIRRVTEAISREFADASAALATVLAQRDRMEQHARACRQAFEVDGQAVRERLVRTREDTAATLGAIARGLDELDRQSRAMTGAASVRAEWVNRLGAVERQLSELAASCPSAVSPSHRPAAIAHLERRYTMAAERRVHASACPYATPAPLPPAAPAPVAPSGLGDNVELF